MLGLCLSENKAVNQVSIECDVCVCREGEIGGERERGNVNRFVFGGRIETLK